MKKDVLNYSYKSTPIGEVVIIDSKEGICALEFIDRERKHTVAQLQQGLQCKELSCEQTSEIKRAEEYLDKLFSDKHPTQADLPRLSLQGTPFQIRVWEELRKLHSEEIVSYSEIARRIGHPKAVRAVANAIGANPISIFIPCHRVIRSDGSLGGYRWGADKKLILLTTEYNQLKLNHQ